MEENSDRQDDASNPSKYEDRIGEKEQILILYAQSAIEMAR